MAWIYTLHLAEPLHHCNHYTGCTESLRDRLIRHANGLGSALTRHLATTGTPWVLGGLQVCSKRQMRKIERALKDQHNSKRYCQLCSGSRTKRMPGCTTYDIGLAGALLGGPPNSIYFATQAHADAWSKIQYRFAQPDDRIAQEVLTLMKKDKDALGFIPAGGPEGLTCLQRSNRLVIADLGGQVVGYTAFTMTPNQPKLNIHQCCVADGMRFAGIGTGLVEFISEMHPDKEFTAKVRNDLAANHFWQAIGFEQVDQQPHKTSGNLINHYHRKSKEQ